MLSNVVRGLNGLTDLLRRLQVKESSSTHGSGFARQLADAIPTGPALIPDALGPMEIVAGTVDPASDRMAHLLLDHIAPLDPKMLASFAPNESSDNKPRQHGNRLSEYAFDPSLWNRYGNNPRVTVNRQTQSAVDYLNSLREHIYRLHACEALSNHQVPGLAVAAKPHQLHAIAQAEYNARSPFRGTFLADPPGLGKTLPAMAIAVRAAATSKMPTIIVVPPNVLRQWEAEFQTFFVPGTVRVLVLDSLSTSPLSLADYDVVLVTCHLLMSSFRRSRQYTANLDGVRRRSKHCTPMRSTLPVRPALNLFSEIFGWRPNQKFPFLILDEATAVKNPDTLTHRAVLSLSKRCEAVVLLSGTPIDNDWHDLMAYSKFLKGHPFDSIKIFQHTFMRYNSEKKIFEAPLDRLQDRLVIFLSAFVIRRPEDTVLLPELLHRNVNCLIDADAARTSNRHYSTYRWWLSEASKLNIRSPEAQLCKACAWDALTKSIYHAWNATLEQIMEAVAAERGHDRAVREYEGDSPEFLKHIKKAAKYQGAESPLKTKAPRQWKNWRQDVRRLSNDQSNQCSLALNLLAFKRD